MEVHIFLHISSVSADSSRCHFGMECIPPFDCVEASPGVFLSQPSPFYALEMQHPASSLLRLQREVA